MPTFLTKIRRNGGGESVIGRHDTEEAAAAQAAAYNEPYQSDNAYVEPFDAAKAAEWPAPGLIRHMIRHPTWRD